MAGRPRASRRRWSVEFKKRVVAEASRLDVSAAQIARRYDLNANLLFNWRKKYGAEGALVAVEILPDDGLGHSNYVPEELDNGGSAASGSGPTHVLEIDLPCGSRLRCGREISAALLERALVTLRTRS